MVVNYTLWCRQSRRRFEELHGNVVNVTMDAFMAWSWGYVLVIDGGRA